jgi:REP element-mobilizing transposase RayT
MEYPDALYHITSRGNEGKAIFCTARDRQDFLDLLARTMDAHKWICHAYCLMNNHYHLLIETPEANLSKGMRNLNGAYAQRWNRIYRRKGHIFQGRFKALLIEKETYLLAVARYIVLNPLKAHLTSRLRGWKWSSYQATAGYCRPPKFLTVDFILSRFGHQRKRAQKEYRQFVKQAADTRSVFDDVEEGNILGFPQFIDNLREFLPDVSLKKEIPRFHRMVGRPTLSDLLAGTKNKEERDEMIGIAYFRCAYSQKEIADFLNIHYSTVSKILVNSRFKT